MTNLAGDIGGTKTILALVEPRDGASKIVRQDKFHSADFPTFEGIVAKFLSAGPASPSAPPASASRARS